MERRLRTHSIESSHDATDYLEVFFGLGEGGGVHRSTVAGLLSTVSHIDLVLGMSAWRCNNSGQESFLTRR